VSWTRAKIGQPMIRGKAPRSPNAGCENVVQNSVSLAYGFEDNPTIPETTDLNYLPFQGVTAVVTSDASAIDQWVSSTGRTGTYGAALSYTGLEISPSLSVFGYETCNGWGHNARVRTGQVVGFSVYQRGTSTSLIGNLILLWEGQDVAANSAEGTYLGVTIASHAMTASWAQVSVSTVVPSSFDQAFVSAYYSLSDTTPGVLTADGWTDDWVFEVS
jgi:hypothetical protein